MTFIARGIARTPLFGEFFASLIGTAYASKREKSAITALVISSLLLSVASGYTTYTGLTEYTPKLVSLLITLAIQGLLFVASWRLGSLFSVTSFKFSVLLIYCVTLSVSVFFSYSALLDYIYKPENRDVDVVRDTALEVTAGYEMLRRKSEERRIDALSDVRGRLLGATSDAIAQADSMLAHARAELEAAIIQGDELSQALAQEIDAGGTPVYNDGVFIGVTPEGEGPYSRRYKQQLNDHMVNIVAPMERLVGDLESWKGREQTILGQLVAGSVPFGSQIVRDLVDNHVRLESIYRSNHVGGIAVRIPDALVTSLLAIAMYGDLGDGGSFRNYVPEQGSTEELIAGAYAAASLLPYIESGELDDYMARVSAVGDKRGAKVHHFVMVLGELRVGNALAVGSLLIALVVDLLILCCGLLGTRPDSFLDIRRPEELEEVKEAALEAVLSLDLESARGAEDRYVRRAATILSVAEPNLDYAYKGIPAVISMVDIRRLGMAKEVGVMIATGHAHMLSDGMLGLRTGLVLWLTEQIVRSYQADQTKSGFIQSMAAMAEEA